MSEPARERAAEVTNCHYCDGWIRDGRITLPRAVTGDLVFCRFICVERWRAKRAGDADQG